MEPDALPRYFDQSSPKGLSCLLCGVLVARLKDMPDRHVAWHARVQGQLSRSVEGARHAEGT